LQGIYRSAAYGDVVLCAAPSPSQLESPPLYSETDVKCREIMSNHPFDGRQLSAPATYVGHYDGSNTMYLRFSHVNGSRYSVSLGQVFPQTGEKLPSIYGTWEAFISPDGIAYGGNAWGAGLGVAASVLDPSDMQRTAEVWFDKAPVEMIKFN
jgi:hypothetical protein